MALMESAFHSGFAAIVGRPNVGKSTLLNTLVGEKVAIVSNKPQTTRNRIMGVCSGNDWQIVFLDTPGRHKPHTKLGEYMMKTVSEALNGIDVLLVMVDIGDRSNRDQNIVEEMKSIPVKKILVLSKTDTVPEEEIFSALKIYDSNGYDAVIPISAKSGQGIKELLNFLVKGLPVGPKYFPDDMMTDQPERVLCSEIIREKALLHLKDEVPHGIGVEIIQIKKRSDSLTDIHATIYCEKEGHKGIIIGKHGMMLQRIGQESRNDIEKLMGTKVNLQLWIKVREDWRNRNSDLKVLGYELDQ